MSTVTDTTVSGSHSPKKHAKAKPKAPAAPVHSPSSGHGQTKAHLSSGATKAQVHASKAHLKYAISPPPTKSEINALLETASKKHGVPADVLKAVAFQESHWNSKAKSFDGHHGKGVMQIDDRSHKFAKTPAVWDPKKNIEYGANLLSTLHKQTGGGDDWYDAVMRYNGAGDRAEKYADRVTDLAEQKPWKAWFTNHFTHPKKKPV